MNFYKESALKWIESNKKNISDWHQIIWNYAEPAWREYKSSAWYVKKLENLVLMLKMVVLECQQLFVQNGQMEKMVLL